MSIKIIAEAGVNHNGSRELAMRMIERAKEAGVDYIKFQTFRPERLVSKNAGKAEYQKAATGSAEGQLEMLKKLSLSDADFIMLQEYCKKLGIGFLSTPFDLDSIAFLDTLRMDFWKLPSGEITNLPYLERIKRTGKPVAMSTGMSTIEEVRAAVSVLRGAEENPVTLLHCNTEYPTPMEDVNLTAMKTLRDCFGLPVGYSDHTLGTEAAIAAAALGACILEKHFTLNRSMEGPDHRASLEPQELMYLVQAVRNVELALGSGEKGPSPSETKNLNAARKSIVAGRDIKRGELYDEENLTVKRPGGGISPMRWHEILGQTASRDYAEDELITEELPE